MRQNKEMANALIKKNQLKKLLNKEGIRRIGKGVLILIEKKITRDTILLAKKMKENLEVNGSKILTTQIIKNTIEESNKEEEVEY